MRGIFYDLETRVWNPIMHELGIGNGPDRIVAAHDDKCGHDYARKIV